MSRKPAQSQQEDTFEESTEDQNRYYTNQQEVDSDLFKLSVSMMKKNHAMDGAVEPIYVDHEHTHIFRTVDSRGKAQQHCSPIGGHFHEVKVEYIGRAKRPKITFIGPPLEWRQSRQGRRTTRVAVQVQHDNHTHTAEYLRSQKIKMAEVSKEFLKLQAALDAKKPGTVDGVQG